MARIRLGISRCLLGEKVRYDGQHKLDRFLRDSLGQHADYLPVCPEVECGLSVPREPMQLEGSLDHPRLVTIRSRRDYTEQMCVWAARRVGELANEGLDGFIFKSRSPSCGTARVKVVDRDGVARALGVGLFARAFMERFPHLPVQEEGPLEHPRLTALLSERC